MENAQEILYQFISHKLVEQDVRCNFKLIHNTCFSKFLPVQDLYTITGFSNVLGENIDIVFVQELERPSLFIQDSLRISPLPLIRVRKEMGSEKLIQMIQKKKRIFPVFLNSDVGFGQQSLIDRLAGILRAQFPETINHKGWFSLLVEYARGKRCLTSELEQILIEKFFQFTIQQCHFSLNFSQDHPLVQGIEKAIHSHLLDQSVGAMFFVIQACSSLYHFNKKEHINSLWKETRRLFSSLLDDYPRDLFKWMDQLMMSSISDPFALMTALLEVQAFLYLSSSKKFEKQKFDASLIFHQNRPAIQLHYPSHFLLLPFEPFEALKRLLSFEKELLKYPDLLDTLQQMEGKLFPQSPFKALSSSLGKNLLNLGLDMKECREYAQAFLEKDLSPFLKKMFEKWWLACHIQDPTSHSERWLNLHFSCFLESYENLGDCQLLLKSAKNGSFQSRAYSQMLSFLEKYPKVPFPLLWAYALLSTGEREKDNERGYLAYTIWNAFNPAPETIYPRFSFQFLENLAIIRPDLLLRRVESLSSHVISLQQSLSLLCRLHTAFETKQSIVRKPCMISAFIKLVEKWKDRERKTFSPELLPIIKWLLLSILKQEDFDFKNAEKIASYANYEMIQLLKDPEFLDQVIPDTLCFLFSKAIQSMDDFDDAYRMTLVELREKLVKKSSSEESEILKDMNKNLVTALQSSEQIRILRPCIELAIKMHDFDQASDCLLKLLSPKRMNRKRDQQVVELIFCFFRSIDPTTLFSYSSLLSHPHLFIQLEPYSDEALVICQTWIERLGIDDKNKNIQFFIFSFILKFLAYASKKEVMASSILSLYQFLILSMNENEIDDHFMHLFEEWLTFLNKNPEFERDEYFNEEFKKKFFTNPQLEKTPIFQKYFKNKKDVNNEEKNVQGRISFWEKIKANFKDLTKDFTLDKGDLGYILKFLFYGFYSVNSYLNFRPNRSELKSIFFLSHSFFRLLQHTYEEELSRFVPKILLKLNSELKEVFIQSVAMFLFIKIHEINDSCYRKMDHNLINFLFVGELSTTLMVNFAKLAFQLSTLNRPLKQRGR